MKASQSVKKYLAPAITAISDAITPLGPGTIAVVVGDLSGGDINLIIHELPTEVVHGSLDGSEIFYGYTLNTVVLHSIIDITAELFVDNEEGQSVVISGKTKIQPTKNIYIKIIGEPPVDVPIGQVLYTNQAKFIPKELPDNIIAVIKGKHNE